MPSPARPRTSLPGHSGSDHDIQSAYAKLPARLPEQSRSGPVPAQCLLPLPAYGKKPFLAPGNSSLARQINTTRSLWTGELIAECRLPREKKSRGPAQWLVRLYRTQISPAIGQRCSLQPSCSEYFRQASAKHGLMGFAMQGDRFFREPSVCRAGHKPVTTAAGSSTATPWRITTSGWGRHEKSRSSSLHPAHRPAVPGPVARRHHHNCHGACPRGRPRAGRRRVPALRPSSEDTSARAGAYLAAAWSYLQCDTSLKPKRCWTARRSSRPPRLRAGPCRCCAPRRLSGENSPTKRFTSSTKSSQPRQTSPCSSWPSVAPPPSR